MDKGNVDKHRLSMSGIKAVEEEKWGRDKARERYGSLKQVDMKPPEQCYPQKLGDPNNLQAPNYYSGEPPVSSWLRAGGERGKPKR